ncbi:MAG: transglycosylase SLT domain-containing protein [Nitrosomonadales bacterium]|nr:transglycosylase SLT domain-containing protein [Nitrosomonadales bacterium]
MIALGADEAPVRDATEEPVVAHAAELPVPGVSPATSPADSAAEPADVPSASTAGEPAAHSPAAAAPAGGDLWQRIRTGFAMRELKSPLIARYERWYAGRPDYVERMTERARRYLHFIVEEVEKRGMPTEIALLPMIESAFNPGAYSVARASGIWQFIPATGKKYGMQQNWWYDGRRDIISATNGALDYLQKLHDQFGDWELALAAYNWGEGAVQRAQERNRKRGKPTNYASLKLPKETRGYVPKLLAVKRIVSDPAGFGLTLQPVPDQPYFSAVTTARHMDVKLAAQLAEISLEEFSALNPAHSRPVILQESDDVLLLPADKVGIFRANLENYSEPLVSWQAYQSKKGEQLDKLAPRFGLSVEKLRLVNGLPSRAMLSNGQALLVPRNDEEAGGEFVAFNTHLAPSDPLLANAITHTVRRGDTLGGIARRYHVKLASLKSWNGGVKILRPGQQIYVVPRGKPVKSANTRTKTAVTRDG